MKYPYAVVRDLEKAGMTFRFESIRDFDNHDERKRVCHIVDKRTGTVIVSESGSLDEDQLLRGAATSALALPKPLSENEARAKVAAQAREIEELRAKLDSANKPSSPKPSAPAGKPQRGRSGTASDGGKQEDADSTAD